MTTKGTSPCHAQMVSVFLSPVSTAIANVAIGALLDLELTVIAYLSFASLDCGVK